MIEEGQLRKYLVYAIGEILLVVIGILLALQINTWSQYKQARTEEQGLLNALHKELVHNEELLSQTTSDIKNGVNRLTAWVEMSSEKVSVISEDSVNFGIIRPIRRFFTTELAVGALNSAINSGRLDLIEHHEIRSQLAQYLATVEDIAELGLVVSDASVDALKIIGEYPELRIFIHSGGIYVPSQEATISAETLRSIKTDPQLLSLVTIKVHYWIAYSAALERLSTQIQEITDLINVELI